MILESVYVQLQVNIVCSVLVRVFQLSTRISVALDVR